MFDITTPLQLTELSRPTHPLLRQLLLKASGTYHHTILVSNMAERAAAAIGADALLVRVGAYYHDIGKTVRPYFFAENIMDETSPHEKLDPLTSAQIIISHVKDGLDLAQKYHLPQPIQDFIREHHGRSLVKYFYVQAQRQAPADEVVNEEDFRYPGPSPRSKETSILLLADTCEAAVRAVKPGSREELEALVDRLIDERMMSGELDESQLTFADLRTVRSVFLQVLQGVHHPRIVYPEPVKGEALAGSTAPAGEEETLRYGANLLTGERSVGNDRSLATDRPLPGGIEEPAMRRPPEAVNMAAEG
jgi:putative nucleotidyltransferase with HDIG domain